LLRFPSAFGIMPEREAFANVLSSTPIERKQLVPSQIQGLKKDLKFKNMNLH